VRDQEDKTVELRSFIIPSIAAGAAILVLAAAAEPGKKSIRKPVPPLTETQKWTKVNPSPLLLPTALNTLCRPITRIETVENPHRNRYFTVYVNKAGTAAMRARKPEAFPRGSIIVKEKLPGRRAKIPELLTAMVKREKGYDPSGGDWEYMALNGSGTKVIESGKLTHCKSCHAGQRNADYVFRTYLPRTGREADSSLR
jgi:hypothetical protein